MRAVLYARVSTTDKQDPEMQLADLREYASRRGWELCGTFVDRTAGPGQGRRMKPLSTTRKLCVLHHAQLPCALPPNHSLLFSTLSVNDSFALLPAPGRPVLSSPLRRTAPAHLDTSPFLHLNLHRGPASAARAASFSRLYRTRAPTPSSPPPFS
jgi:hypothetical protein